MLFYRFRKSSFVGMGALKGMFYRKGCFRGHVLVHAAVGTTFSNHSPMDVTNKVADIQLYGHIIYVYICKKGHILWFILA